MKLIIIERTQNNMSEILLSMEIEEFGTNLMNYTLCAKPQSNFMPYVTKILRW